MGQLWSISLSLCLLLLLPNLASAQLVPNYYAGVCPNVETIVRKVVKTKIEQTFVTIPATLRLFFHDCIVQGCDASVLIASTENNKAEKDHPDNLSLAGDGFDTVIKAKAAVDEIPSCKNKVSCADILALATRDVIALSGGPSYQVELGRLDGVISKSSNVDGKIPKPNFDLNQLTRLFALNGLNRLDLIALSAGHTVGFSHCDQLANRIYNYSIKTPIDPTINKTYAIELRAMCPIDVDPRVAINLDPTTPKKFDNLYFKNLQQGKGLFSSDQVLYTDLRSRPAVDIWATNPAAFQQAFIIAITRLGRTGVKTGGNPNGNIRRDCSVFN